jgi:hypothetical protein
VKEGVKDLFEKHSQADIGSSTGTGNRSDVRPLIERIPKQRLQMNRRVDEIYTMMEEDDKTFFEYLRGIPNHKSYGEMTDSFFNFRVKVDGLNKKLDENMN